MQGMIRKTLQEFCAAIPLGFFSGTVMAQLWVTHNYGSIPFESHGKLTD